MMITTTIKIPKPIPALKIPAMALHELTIKEISSMINAVSSFDFFIADNFFMLYFKIIVELLIRFWFFLQDFNSFAFSANLSIVKIVSSIFFYLRTGKYFLKTKQTISIFGNVCGNVFTCFFFVSFNSRFFRNLFFQLILLSSLRYPEHRCPIDLLLKLNSDVAGFLVASLADCFGLLLDC